MFIVPKTNYSDEELRLRKKFSKVKSSIKYRTTNRNCPRYPQYGGRGIYLCEEWDKSLDAFIMDCKTLENYDEDLFLSGKLALDKDIKGYGKVYDKHNCMWTTLEENNKVKPSQQKPFTVYNTETNKYLGVFENQSDVAGMLGVYPATISSALRLRGYYKHYLIQWITTKED